MNNKNIKIVFIMPSLVAGGAQRIMSFMAQNLDKSQFESTLLIIGFKEDTVYELEGIKVLYLNKQRVLHAVKDLIKYFRTEKPDIVITSIIHLNTLVAFISIFFPSIKFIAREANVLSVLKAYNNNSKIYFPKFIKVTAYKLVDCLICQSNDMQHDMINNYNVPKNKVALINNPLTQNFKVKLAQRDENAPLKFITIARLSKEKGHERLIEILAKLNFSFTYTIIGNGSEKENIFNLIKENKLESYINYINYTSDIGYYLSQSDVFLQGSYVEGLPNAVIESCAVGTPVIAIKAPGGIDEIIENSINGYLVNDEDEFISCLNTVNDNYLFNPELVSESVKHKFNSEKIISQYEALFNRILKK